MYHYMSLCNIPILSSFKPKHRFTSNFMWMFPGRVPTKIFKIGVLPLFSMELWVILCNFWSILKNSFSIRLLTRNHSYIWFGSLQMTLFLDYL